MAKKGSNVKGALWIILILAILVSVLALQNKTFFKPKATGPSNLNTSSKIAMTTNADGTMGPATWYGNFSNALPASQKGILSFNVIDPPQSDKANENAFNNPSSNKRPTGVLPSQAQVVESGSSGGNAQSNQNKGGTQEITALNLTISKVEVHLAYLGEPGSKKDVTGTPSPTTTPGQHKKSESHWETLNVAPQTVDLVKLAETKDVQKLGLTSLAAGRYTEVRLYVTGASATLGDGTTVDLTLLGKDHIVRVVRTFTISAGETTKLTMDFDAKRSVIKAGDKYILRPVVARLLQE